MTKLLNKVDFAVLFSTTNANPNGDPLNGNRPRTDYYGFGEISDVCIKRKIRNRMQDLGEKIFVQSDDRADDGYGSLKERAEGFLKKEKDPEKYRNKACENWIDVRAFGQVFAFKGNEGVSVGVRGPVSIHQVISLSPVEIESQQITKSVNGESKNDGKKSSDTMGMKHFVRYGLYLLKGSINVQLAEKTGFSEEDAELLKECLRTLFVNDSSSARPDGSMEIEKIYWWKHNCKDGQYSSAKVHKTINVTLKDGVQNPKSIEDYDIKLNRLEGLDVEIIDGI